MAATKTVKKKEHGAVIDAVTTTLVDVTIPAVYVRLASEWSMGVRDALQSLASFGAVIPGDRRPFCENARRFLTDGEWHVSLWVALESNVRLRAKGLERLGHEDAATMRQFESFCIATASMLRRSYGISSSEAA